MTNHESASGSIIEAECRPILERYAERTPRSAELYSRATRSLAGGTTGNLRHFTPYPLYFVSGEGSRMVDADGHSYIDCFLCNGPLLLGHRPSALDEIGRRLGEIGSLVVNPPLAMELAEAMQGVIEGAEKIRFLNSGTEAVLSAVRLARAATGKARVIKFFGHYHGQDDQFMVGLQANPSRFGAGVPRESVANTRLLPYGNLAAIEAAVSTDADIAAVILDPAMHSGGLWGSEPEYLRALRDLTRRRGIALIFDEVITGFRLGLKGAQGHYGVVPDLATYAKALGAGEKLAAVVGTERFMAGVDSNRRAGTPVVFQSGTGNDGTGGLAAGLAAVRAYRRLEHEGAYAVLNAHAARLAAGLRHAFRDHGIPLHVNQLGPMLQLFMTDKAPSFEAYCDVPTRPLELFYLALINEGVLLSLPTSNHVYLSFAHTEADITRILDAVSTVLERHDFARILEACS